MGVFDFLDTSVKLKIAGFLFLNSLFPQVSELDRWLGHATSWLFFMLPRLAFLADLGKAAKFDGYTPMSEG